MKVYKVEGWKDGRKEWEGRKEGRNEGRKEWERESETRKREEGWVRVRYPKLNGEVRCALWRCIRDTFFILQFASTTTTTSETTTLTLTLTVLCKHANKQEQTRTNKNKQEQTQHITYHYITLHTLC